MNGKEHIKRLTKPLKELLIEQLDWQLLYHAENREYSSLYEFVCSVIPTFTKSKELFWQSWCKKIDKNEPITRFNS